MGWREQLKTGASFRGVPFSTSDTELRLGRRTVTHEYPARDLPYTEDLGRRARRFTVEAWVIGENYLSNRNSLIEALETAGPGELVHPRWGTLQVQVDDGVGLRESPREGGKAHFSITFVEAGDNTFPQVVADTVAEVEDAAAEVDDAAEDDFADVFSIEGASVLFDQGLTGLKSQLDGVVSMVRGATAATVAGELVRTISGISTDLTSLIHTPVAYVQRIRGLLEDFGLSLVRPLGALADLRATFAGNTRPSQAILSAPLPGSTRARLLTNQVATSDLQRRLSLSSQARALAVALQADGVQEPVISTAAKAVQLRDVLLAQIDTELEVNDPPASLASALGQLRVAVIRDVSARAEQLRQASSFTPQAVLPSLLLAQRLYQDASRAEELELRNGVRNPLFVPARPIEVLR